MVAKMPRSTSFLMTRSAFTSSFSESSLTVMPSEMVMSRLMGGGPAFDVPALRPERSLFFGTLATAARARASRRGGRARGFDRRRRQAGFHAGHAKWDAAAADRRGASGSRAAGTRRAAGALARDDRLAGADGTAINGLAGNGRTAAAWERRDAARRAHAGHGRARRARAWRQDRAAAELLDARWVDRQGDGWHGAPGPAGRGMRWTRRTRQRADAAWPGAAWRRGGFRKAALTAWAARGPESTCPGRGPGEPWAVARNGRRRPRRRGRGGTSRRNTAAGGCGEGGRGGAGGRHATGWAAERAGPASGGRMASGLRARLVFRLRAAGGSSRLTWASASGAGVGSTCGGSLDDRGGSWLSVRLDGRRRFFGRLPDGRHAPARRLPASISRRQRRGASRLRSERQARIGIITGHNSGEA